MFQTLSYSFLLSLSVPAAAGIPRAPLRSLQAEEVPDVQEHQVLRRRPLRHLRRGHVQAVQSQVRVLCPDRTHFFTCLFYVVYLGVY